MPFRDESSLILENETAELAFQRLMNVHSSAYHAKLQTILDARGTCVHNVCVCVCVCVCVGARVRACVCVCVYHYCLLIFLS